VFGFDLKPAYAQLRTLKIARANETRSTCPYCAVGCGTIIYTIGDRAKNVTAQVVHVEGDPDHPTNRGTLCPKGASLQQDIMNDRRLLKPQVRRPGGLNGKTFPGTTPERNCRPGQKTRDESFIEKDAAGHTVNRSESIAWIGGCTDTNEFNYLVVKAMRALGSCTWKTRPELTRPHGLKFGTNVWPGRNDERLGRHQEHRHDADHGREPGRKSPLRFQMGSGSQA